MGLFCDHDWQNRTGMDSGSVCSKCHTTSSREVDINKSSPLSNGVLESRIDIIREKFTKQINSKNPFDI